PPRRVPAYGRRSGNRNSWLKTSIACPPTGKPVTESRGPAWFNANPRNDVPPPAKNLSGRGIRRGGGTCVGAGNVRDIVSLYGVSIPIRTDRATLNRRLTG